MKILKKFAGMVLAVCLMVPMFGAVAFAAEGRLMYTDPSTKVGENVEIELVVTSDSGETVGDVQVNMSYDPEYLEFLSGDGFTADGSGALSYEGTGDGAELRATVTFYVLQTGEAKLTVDGTTASMASGEELTLREGSSTVTIEAADDGTTSVEPQGTGASTAGETTDIVVSVNGTDYNFSEAYTGNDIPAGYAETTLTFEGEERKFVANEAGVTLGFLVDGSGAGSFFLYNEEDATFSPFIALTVSDTTSIVPLGGAESVTLPETYQEVELTVQEQTFPAWSDPMTPRYYVLRALNTRTGETALYQYDTDDGTYQYFIAPAEEEETGLPIPGKIGELINDNLLILVIAVGAVGLLIFILMIMFAVKLVHRNQELDDLYDEYDIPFDDEEEEVVKKDKKNKKSKKGSSRKSDDYDDEYDDYDEEYDDDGYPDDEYDDEYDDGYDEEYDDGYDEDGYDDGYDEDDEDDYADRRQATTRIKKKGKGRRGGSDDDDYNISFIDL